jgi:hypothetical protein
MHFFCKLLVPDDTIITTCIATCIALLAAALIVLSLLNLQPSGPGTFKLELETRRERALTVVRVVQVTIWSSGVGALEGLAALVLGSAAMRIAAVGLAMIATVAFLTMAAKTVSAVVSATAKGD